MLELLCTTQAPLVFTSFHNFDFVVDDRFINHGLGGNLQHMSLNWLHCQRKVS